MKKYIKPVLEEEKVEIEDVVAVSVTEPTCTIGGSQPGDHDGNFFKFV
ncbi:MAG: hypothetical protein K2I77_03460 [Anaeroplasmataceae bacterium]|nr:hypothetical protein [Anaeroplasmataceae bacterium]